MFTKLMRKLVRMNMNMSTGHCDPDPYPPQHGNGHCAY